MNWLLVSKFSLEFDDRFLFIFSEVPPLDVRTEVVDPPQTAALSTAKQPYRIIIIIIIITRLYSLKNKKSPRDNSCLLVSGGRANCYGHACLCRRLASCPPPTTKRPCSARPCRSKVLVFACPSIVIAAKFFRVPKLNCER